MLLWIFTWVNHITLEDTHKKAMWLLLWIRFNYVQNVKHISEFWKMFHVIRQNKTEETQTCTFQRSYYILRHSLPHKGRKIPLIPCGTNLKGSNFVLLYSVILSSVFMLVFEQLFINFCWFLILTKSATGFRIKDSQDT